MTHQCHQRAFCRLLPLSCPENCLRNPRSRGDQQLSRCVPLDSLTVSWPCSDRELEAGSLEGASLYAWVPPILVYDQVKPKTERPPWYVPPRFASRETQHRTLGKFAFDRCSGTGEVIPGSVPSSVDTILSGHLRVYNHKGLDQNGTKMTRSGGVGRGRVPKSLISCLTVCCPNLVFQQVLCT